MHEGLKPARLLDLVFSLAAPWGCVFQYAAWLLLSLCPHLENRTGTCSISQACCEGMCTDMFCKLKRDGKSCGTVIVHSVCVYVCVCVRACTS